MAKKPSYEELEQRVKELEREMMEGWKAIEETERLKSAIERSIDGIAIGNVDEGFTYVNNAYAEMHGYSPQEMIGMRVWDVYDPELPEQPREISEQLRTQGSFRSETGRIRKDGTPFLALQSTTAMESPSDDSRWAVTICRDITEQKRTEERIGTLSSAVEQSIDGISIGNDQGFTYVNKAYAKMHGYSPQEMIGMNVADVYDPESPEHPYDIYEQLSTQGSYRGETGRIRKDGTSFTAFQSSTAIAFPDSNIRWAVTICRDVTEQRRIEERIGTLSSAVEQSIDGISIGNNDEGFTYVNNAYAEMHGYSPEEMIGMRVIHVYDPKFREKAPDVFEQIRTQGSFQGETVHIRKDGTPFLTFQSITGMKFSGGKTQGGVSICKDITEQKRSEKRIETLSSAVEQSIDGIATSHFERGLTYVNNAFAAMHGYSPEEMIGMHPGDFLKEESLISLTDIRNHLEKQGSHICDMIHVRKDGTAFPAFESFTILKDDDGKIIGPLAVCRDITQIKEAEEMLQESEERYRILFEEANDAIFIVDEATHVILEANKQAERLIDRPRQDIIGLHQSVFHRSVNEEWYEEEYLDQVDEKGRDFEEGAEVIDKNGKVIPVFISSKVVSIRGKKVIQSLFRDIDAERKYLDLKEEMITRKLTDKARRILMDRYGINEVEAMNRLRKESRRQSKKLKHISQAVISSELILE
jgi:PAS domain S-box-containing protein